MLVGSQDWRQATSRLAADVRPGDAVGFPNSFYRIVVEYYATAGRDRPGGRLTADPVLPANAWGSLRPYELDRIKRLALQSTPDDIIRQVADRPSVWLADVPGDQLETAQRALLARGYRLTETIELSGVTLRHLTRQ